MAETTVAETLQKTLHAINDLPLPELTHCPECSLPFPEPKARSGKDSTVLTAKICSQCHYVYQPKVTSTKVE